MAIVYKDRVKQVITGSGTGDLTFGDEIGGFVSFPDAVTSSDEFYYTIVSENSVNDWEVGIGAISSDGTSLLRNEVLTSGTGEAIDFDAADDKEVFITAAADALGRVDNSVSDTQTMVTDQQLFLELPRASESLPVVDAAETQTNSAVDSTQLSVVDGVSNYDVGYSAGLPIVVSNGLVVLAEHLDVNPAADSNFSNPNFVSSWIGNAGKYLYTLWDDFSVTWISRWGLSTPWDITTATVDNEEKVNYNSDIGDVRNIQVSPDGTILVLLSTNGTTTYTATLSTPWDITTAGSFTSSTSFNSQSQDIRAFYIDDAGTNAAVLAKFNNEIYRYTLSTAWDVTTASYQEAYDATALFENTVRTLTVGDDGATLIAGLARDNPDFYQIKLTNAWDFSSIESTSTVASMTPTNFESPFGGGEDRKQFSIQFSPNGNSFVVLFGTSLLDVPLNSAWDISSYKTFSDLVGRLCASPAAEEFKFITAETTSPALTFVADEDSWNIVAAFKSVDSISTISNPYAITFASYDSVSFGISGQDTDPSGVVFNSDGTKMFITGANSFAIYQYTLSTGFDLSTASYDTVTFDVSLQETNPEETVFNSDGTKMFVIGSSSDAVHQYTLGTGFDLSTASYDSVSFDVSGQELAPHSLAFSSDGTKMFMTGTGTDTVYQYTLSTGFDLSTASYDSVSFDVSEQDAAPSGVSFNSDGTKMFMVGFGSDAVYQYTLGTGFDLSTASYDGVPFGVEGQDNTPHSIAFSSDGYKMYILGSGSDSVYQYTTVSYLETGAAVTNNLGQEYAGAWAAINSVTATETLNSQSLYYAYSPDNRQTFYVHDANGTRRPIVRYENEVWEYNASDYPVGNTWEAAETNALLPAIQEAVLYTAVPAAYDLTKAGYDAVSFDTSSQDIYPHDVKFNVDGTKMFVLGYSSTTVYQYSLSNGFDLSDVSYDSVSFDVGGQEPFSSGIAFNTDGTKMYVTGVFSSGEVHQYTLTTGFDLSTASYDSVSLDVSGQETGPEGVAFNSDGTKLFVIGSGSDSVHQYTLGTGFDLSTASYDSVSFDVSGEEGSFPRSVAFNPDGTKMFTTGSASDAVHQYTLGTGFDLSTASYDDEEFDVSGQDGLPQGLILNPDGTKVFIAGRDSGSIYQYSFKPTYELQALEYDEVSFSVSAQESQPIGMAFSSDGTKMFVVGRGTNTVYQYTLTTGFDLTTASYDTVSFDVSGQDLNPQGMAFNPDGTKMFIAGSASDSIHQYTLTTGFDLSTASYDSVSFDVSGQVSALQGLTFSSGGTKMFVVGNGADSIYQYTLTTGFDLSTASYDSVSLYVGEEDITPTGVTFNPTGTKMFLIGSISDSAHQYTLGTGFDLSTANYDSVSFDVSGQDTSPEGLVFSTDGTKIFVVGDTSNSIYQYSAKSEFINNQMNSTTFTGSTTPQELALGATYDVGVVFSSDTENTSAEFSGVTVNYDAEDSFVPLTNGTDYSYEAVDKKAVRFKALADKTYTIKVKG